MSERVELQPQPEQPSLVQNEGVDAGSREVLEQPATDPDSTPAPRE